MTSWFGFHSTNLKAPVPTGRFPNSVPDVSTARGLAMSKTNIARLARNGACGSLRVMRRVCVPTASTFATTDLSSKPPNCASQYSNVWRSEEHTSELQSHSDLVCRLLLEKKK